MEGLFRAAFPMKITTAISISEDEDIQLNRALKYY